MTDTADCEDARLLISRALDRELDAEGGARLERHLASCAPCRAERTALEGASGLIASAFEEHPFDEALVREIVGMAGIGVPARTADRPVAEPRGLLVKLRAAALVAAAAAAVVIVALDLGRGGASLDEPARGTPAVAVGRAFGRGVRVTTTKGLHLAPVTEDGESQPVHAGDVVLNGGGPAALVLEDGTRVDLRSDTAVSIHQDRDGGTTVAMAQGGGEIYCEVQKRKRPFRVSASTVTATVLGTRFLVRSTSREASVSVLEGRVQVASNSQQVVLSADQEASLAADRPVLSVRPLASVRERLSWDAFALKRLPAPALPVAAPVPSATPAGAAPGTGASAPIDPSLDAPVEPKKAPPARK